MDYEKLKYKEEVREKIMRAGSVLFKTKGFENTSMKDIAQSAEISTGNIYRYFLTKHHLLCELQQEMEKDLEDFFISIPLYVLLNFAKQPRKYDYNMYMLNTSLLLIIFLSFKSPTTI